MPQVFSTLKPQAGDTIRILEAKILASVTGSGGGGSGPVTAGAGAPSIAPLGGAGLYIQTDSNPAGLVWEYYGGAWH